MTGEIPEGIGSLSILRLLNLSGNQLEGVIPASIGNISKLEVLDLSKNNLKGQIPEELSILHELSILDVSSNHLCGPIPRGTQISTFNVSSFQENKCLCGFPLHPCGEREIPMIKGNDSSKNHIVKVGWFHRVDEKISVVALGIGLGIGFGGTIAMLNMWEKARLWMSSLWPIKPQPYYGVYRFPT